MLAYKLRNINICSNGNQPTVSTSLRCADRITYWNSPW